MRFNSILSVKYFLIGKGMVMLVMGVIFIRNVEKLIKVDKLVICYF